MHELELPFQWDDGTCISPFVATSNNTLVALSKWLHDVVLQHGENNSLRLTDLGCGDGAALLQLCCELFLLQTKSCPLHLIAVGVDIDESLITDARRAAADAVAKVPSPHQLQHDFAVADLRGVAVDEYFPLSETDSHVLFLYLLPEALNIIRDKLLEVIQRVRFVVSNRWDIPFFSNWKIGQLHTLNVYSYRGENINLSKCSR
ncbi:hypothetical protein, conserved [Trypanosoma brucei brucei TREU927]|uniref:Methyltransferase domain-containing protein n=1 Tax=Trypanosoma brucei brucei (strain 927/4 GUTat10.1) TaxID=185431 RepID=Q57YX1_TRYB2|nr:hypothetical protein, conserved [Trypanosoma brucei brucei TREU927]AAX79661.1 hypothetical protein, conserved [Trypanosoma brucei]AAZ13107.1 hypothetical protein, conserved [Trypanosoma brucei brucei TREU927]